MNNHPDIRPFQTLAAGIYRQLYPNRLDPKPNHPSLVSLESQFAVFACEARHYTCPDALTERIVGRANYLYEQQYGRRTHSAADRSRVVTALAWGLCLAAGSRGDVMARLMKRTYLGIQTRVVSQHTPADAPSLMTYHTVNQQ